MRQKVNVLYRNAAEEFARRVASALGDQVASIVLYGSVARKQAKRASDTDVLVVGAGSYVRDKVLDIAYVVMEGSHFEAFISVVYFSRQELQELIQLGSPFISSVLKQGTILYDDGTVSRVREEAAAASR